jgi:hypothetical protein
MDDVDHSFEAVMSRRVDWSRIRQRARTQRYGSESVTGSTPPSKLLPELSPPPRRRPPGKAELRAEGERALAEWKAQQRRPLKETKP